MSTIAPERPQRFRGRRPRPHAVEVSVSNERGLTVIRLNAEDLPAVAVVDLEDGLNRMLCIGSDQIAGGNGGNVDFFDEAFYTHQLVEAVAALRFLRSGDADVD
jgi:hypothetical protein